MLRINFDISLGLFDASPKLFFIIKSDALSWIDPIDKIGLAEPIYSKSFPVRTPFSRILFHVNKLKN